MYEVRCSFCHRREHHELRIVHGPNGVNICERCVHKAQDALDQYFQVRYKRGPGW